MPGEKDIEQLLLLLPSVTVECRDALRADLALCINELILRDFHRLVQCLYRLDVSEEKLKHTLKQHPQADAGLLMADMIIARTEEKERTKALFKRDDHIPDDERW